MTVKQPCSLSTMGNSASKQGQEDAVAPEAAEAEKPLEEDVPSTQNPASTDEWPPAPGSFFVLAGWRVRGWESEGGAPASDLRPEGIVARTSILEDIPVVFEDGTVAALPCHDIFDALDRVPLYGKLANVVDVHGGEGWSLAIHRGRR